MTALAPLDPGLPPYVLALEQRLAEYLSEADLAIVHRAWVVGDQAHAGQTRKSGEPYITHPIAVADILAKMQVDADTVAAAILHDVVEDTPVTREVLAAAFGENVATMVDGVTKLDKLKFNDAAHHQAENLRKMILAMADDLRVVLIKLADRLHNMRTLGAMPAEKRRRIATETLDIYAPLADRLGMARMRQELEQLAFENKYPRRGLVMADRIERSRSQREHTLESVSSILARRLKEHGISGDISGRVKAPYSVYRKLAGRADRRASILDLIGLRVIVDDVLQCYQVLGIVHQEFRPEPGRFKDYIAAPKPNGYQSLHTVVQHLGDHDGAAPPRVEVQIRTRAMHRVAEFGIAAHWAYKDGTGSHERAQAWLRELTQRQSETGTAAEFLETLKAELFPEDVFVLSPAGEVFSLPQHSTVLDFAYAVHTEVGNHAVASWVNGKTRPLRTRLTSGDKVEIVTAKAKQPNPTWLEFVRTGRARTAIRNFLRKQEHEDSIDLGHRLLDRALAAIGATLDAVGGDRVEEYLQRLDLPRLEALLDDIGRGNRIPSVTAKQLVGSEGMDAVFREPLTVGHSEGSAMEVGPCCFPLPGDRIMGYLSAGRGLMIHRESCRNVREYRNSPDRWIDVVWDRETDRKFQAGLRVLVQNRRGVLGDIGSSIANADCDIDTMEYLDRDGATATIKFLVHVTSRQHLERVIQTLKLQPVVLDAQRDPDLKELKSQA